MYGLSFSNSGVPEQPRKASESLSPFYLRHKSPCRNVLQIFTRQPEENKNIDVLRFCESSALKSLHRQFKMLQVIEVALEP